MTNRNVKQIARKIYKLGLDPSRACAYDIVEVANECGIADYDIDELVSAVRVWRPALKR